MKTQTVYILSALLSIITPSLVAQPIQAVIGFNNSQVVEENTISLTPIPGSLLPLENTFTPIQYPSTHPYTNWIDNLGKTVRIEHHQRALAYTGTLESIDSNSNTFSIRINGNQTKLPLTAFYLIPLTQEEPQDKLNSLPYSFSYKTDQLSWTPQLNLIIKDDKVELLQHALLKNHSNANIQIKDSLLHYSRDSRPVTIQTQRTLASLESTPSVNYENNEVSYPIGKDAFSISPYSELLYPLTTQINDIEKHHHLAKLYTSNNTNTVNLTFQSEIFFTLKENGLPGMYQVFWQESELLIPANTATLETVRAGKSVQIVTNKSQDITGTMTLLSSTSKTFPRTQEWKVSIENHSNEKQHYAIEQTLNGIVKAVKTKYSEDADVNQINANSLSVTGSIDGNAKKEITFTVEQ